MKYVLINCLYYIGKVKLPSTVGYKWLSLGESEVTHRTSIIKGSAPLTFIYIVQGSTELGHLFSENCLH